MSALKNFLRLESAGGILLMMAAGLAMIIANTPLGEYYEGVLKSHLAVTVEGKGIDKPLLLWINDGLMAVFFLLVGLELKREILEGELSQRDQVLLPAGAAIGGIAIPSSIYAFLNWNEPAPAINGWAIPAATDIAFALGILAMLGDRVSRGLKTFLLSLAVFDDIAAILIIAAFYTDKIDSTAMILSVAGILALILLAKRGCKSIPPYLLVGLFLWVCVLKSGVHATVAGVILGLFIPLKGDEKHKSPLHRLEHALHPYVAFGILPLFAFANAGVALSGDIAGALTAPVTLGIFCGLVLGKPIGVMAVVFLMRALNLAKLPTGATMASMFGVSLLAGIGFTMSLFIGALAFKDPAEWAEKGVYVRVGVLGASVVAAILGFFLLKMVTKPGAAKGED